MIVVENLGLHKELKLEDENNIEITSTNIIFMQYLVQKIEILFLLFCDLLFFI